jgi:hypothetical protein
MSPEVIAPNPWMILPFALWLGAMALAPLLAAQWWLRHYPKVSLGPGTIGAKDVGERLNQHALNLLAISVGAVFFGAATDIGNGPNFMVKAVADRQKIRTPTFPDSF